MLLSKTKTWVVSFFNSGTGASFLGIDVLDASCFYFFIGSNFDFYCTEDDLSKLIFAELIVLLVFAVPFVLLT